MFMLKPRLFLVALFPLFALACPFAHASEPVQDGGAAQYRLALEALEGKETNEDMASGIVLLKSAAEQGSAEAANRLGYMYDNGLGVAADDTVARQWFEKAAATSHPKAQFNLARFLMLGLGGPTDSDRAIQLFESAAEKGLLQAQFVLGEIFYNGDHGQKKDFKRAFAQFLKAAEAGDAESQNYVGTMYCFGQGVKLNREESVAWYRKAADQNHAKAQNSLGEAYLYGSGIPRDQVQGYKYMLLSADQGEVVAIRNIEDLEGKIDLSVQTQAVKEAHDFRSRLATQAAHDSLSRSR